MSRENEELVHKLFAALNRRDLDAYLACCVEDVELHPVTSGIEGSYVGREGIRRFFADLADASPDFQIEVERVEAVGQRVLVFERASGTGRASGVGAEFELAGVYDFAEDLIKRIRIFGDRQEALEAVGLRE